MKKIYIKPDTETVNVRLYSSVLDDPGLHDNSVVAGGMDAKENNLLFEDDTFGDLWSDGGDTGNSYDIWNE
jgi:hypothetical protein